MSLMKVDKAKEEGNAVPTELAEACHMVSYTAMWSSKSKGSKSVPAASKVSIKSMSNFLSVLFARFFAGVCVILASLMVVRRWVASASVALILQVFNQDIQSPNESVSSSMMASRCVSSSEVFPHG